MTYVIPSGQEDLVQNNIEFLEFWVQAILPGVKIQREEPFMMENLFGSRYYFEDVIPNVA